MTSLMPRVPGRSALAPAAALGLVLVGALSACNGDSAAPQSSGAASSSAAAPEAEASPTVEDAAAGDEGAATDGDAGDPAEALRVILQAYQDGDVETACDRQTARYTAFSIRQTVKLGALPAGSTCADTVEFARSMAAKFGRDNVGGSYDVISDDGQTAIVEHDQSGQAVTYTLVVEDGAWHLDAEDYDAG